MRGVSGTEKKCENMKRKQQREKLIIILIITGCVLEIVFLHIAGTREIDKEKKITSADVKSL